MEFICGLLKIISMLNSVPAVYRDFSFTMNLMTALFSCRVDPTDEGDYQLCFENKFSKMSEKMVFFKVVVSDADQGQYAWDEWIEQAMPENLLDYKLQDIRVRIEKSPGAFMDIRRKVLKPFPFKPFCFIFASLCRRAWNRCT